MKRGSDSAGGSFFNDFVILSLSLRAAAATCRERKNDGRNDELVLHTALSVRSRKALATGYDSRMQNDDEVVRASFARQTFMSTIGATLERVADGEVEIALRFRDDLLQQGGALHAGVLAAIADSACGYAALTRMPQGSEVLSVEFKLNLLAPARGPRVVARARVIRSGRTLSVCSADVFSEETLVATMTATMIRRQT